MNSLKLKLKLEKQLSEYIGWRWRHFNDFIYVYCC